MFNSQVLFFALMGIQHNGAAMDIDQPTRKHLNNCGFMQTKKDDISKLAMVSYGSNHRQDFEKLELNPLIELADSYRATY